MKRILIGISIPLVVIGSFLIGVKYQQRQNDNVYKASTSSTNDFVDRIITSNLDYNFENQTYKNSIQKSDFDKLNSTLNGGKITGLYTLTSPIENQTFYTITTKDNRTVTLIISASKIDGKWVVTRSSLVES